MHINDEKLKPVSAPTQKQNGRKKYFPNDYIDNQLRAIYAKRMAEGRKAVPPLRELGKKVGWPKHALTQRVRKLGLSRVKETRWSEAELEILARYAHRNPYAVQKRLKAAGFHRTPTAIHVKLNRMHFRQGTPYLSATALANLLGCDSHAVTRWIKLGYLQAKRKGTERVPQQGGDCWLIHEDKVRQFILAHPTEFDIRRVTDQLWFLDIVTNGKVGGGFVETMPAESEDQ